MQKHFPSQSNAILSRQQQKNEKQTPINIKTFPFSLNFSLMCKQKYPSEVKKKSLRGFLITRIYKQSKNWAIEECIQKVKVLKATFPPLFRSKINGHIYNVFESLLAIGKSKKGWRMEKKSGANSSNWNFSQSCIKYGQ